MLNNNSQTITDDEGFRRVGAPTEISLKVLAEQIGSNFIGASDDHEAYEKSVNHVKEGVLEFSSKRKMMSTVVSGCPDFTEAKNTMLIKGASERVLDSCDTIKTADGKVHPLTAADKELIRERLRGYESNALRVIGIGVNFTGGLLAGLNDDNKHDLLADFDKYNDYEKGGTFLGFVGIRDPPREEVPEAIHTCKTAGIRVIMITGDSKVTAQTIAKEVGILDERVEGRSYTGAEFMKMSTEEKHAMLNHKGGMAFSRVEPAHKRELVKLLSEQVSELICRVTL